MFDTLSNGHYNIEIYLNKTSGHKPPQDTMYGVHHKSSMLLTAKLFTGFYKFMAKPIKKAELVHVSNTVYIPCKLGVS